MMKYSILLLTIAVLVSCKAWDPTLIGVTNDPLSPKLLTLDKRMEDLANTTVKTSDDELKLFTKEVEENLIDPYGDKYGYIVMKRQIHEYKFGFMPWLFFNVVGVYTPMLFGVPFSKPSIAIEIELRVMDSQNRLIGKYSAVGRAKNTIAAYYGYSSADAWRKTFADGVNDAFDQIRPKIKADVERLNEKLKEAGKL